MKKRFNPSLGSSLTTLGVLVAVGLVLSIAAIGNGGGDSSDAGSDKSTDVTQVATDDAALATDGGVATEGGGASGGSGTATQGGGGRTGSGAAGAGAASSSGCTAGKNGGSTDVGVTGGSIKLAATVVLDGPGASFLAPVRTSMNSVTKRVNSQGGICGRTLNMILRNDSWDAQTGNQFIQNFVQGEKVFALAVVPSSEGLQAADNFIKESKTPVVGSDGMLIHQYQNPWVWPVATPTISTMHIIAKDAYERASALTPAHMPEFGIVFDAHYHFGIEGAYAFNQAYKRLSGQNIPGFNPADPEGSLKGCRDRFCGVQPNQPSYSSEAREFYGACGMADGTKGSSTGNRCDFVAVLLEPDTATTWFQAPHGGQPRLAPHGAFAGAQPLFNRGFAESCKAACDGMWVWTGYNPPIDALAAQPGVAKYVNEVRAESSSVDVTNQFVEGGYQGMQLLVEALKRVGAKLTRDGLRQQLDNMTLDTGLSKPLTWRAGNHFANVSARGFEIQYKTSFGGWQQVRDFLVDPWVGQDALNTK